jgi:hypothetical protein
VISTIIASDSWLQEFGYPDSGLIGAVVSLFDVGCLFGALSNAWTACEYFLAMQAFEPESWVN